MRVLTLLLTALLASAVSGCSRGGKAAAESAKGMQDILKSYQAEVKRKIDAEETAYKQFDVVLAEEKREQTLSLLATERLERSERLADEILDRKSISRSRLKTALGEYAARDFNETRGLLEGEAKARTQLAGTIASLDFDAKRLEELSAALEPLSKPRSRAQQLKQLQQFASQFKTELNKLGCEDLKAEVKHLEEQIAALTARIAELNNAGKDTSKEEARKKALSDQLAQKRSLVQARGCS